MEHSETIAKIAAAMVKAQKSMGSASKSADNPFFKSKYADFNEVRKTVIPPLNENGIAVFQTPKGSENGRIEVETILVHESGEWISGTVSLKPKADDPQGAGSAITYGRRYGLSALCALGAEDDDGEGAMARGKKSNPLTKEQIEKIDSRIQKLNVDKPQFFKYLQIENLSDLTQADLKKVESALATKEKQAKK